MDYNTPLDIKEIAQYVIEKTAATTTTTTNDNNVIVNIEGIDNSLINKEIRSSLFPLFHRILVLPSNQYTSKNSPSPTKALLMRNSGKQNNGTGVNNFRIQGFLYLFDKSAKDYYANDGIKWIKTKLKVRMIIIDDKGQYKLKTHKKDIGSHVIRRQAFDGVCDQGIFWRKYEYKLIKKECNDDSNSSNNSNNSNTDSPTTSFTSYDKFVVQDWPILVHYLTKESSDTTSTTTINIDNLSPTLSFSTSVPPTTTTTTTTNTTKSNNSNNNIIHVDKQRNNNNNSNIEITNNNQSIAVKRDATSSFLIPSISSSVFNLFKKKKTSTTTTTTSNNSNNNNNNNNNNLNFNLFFPTSPEIDFFSTTSSPPTVIQQSEQDHQHHQHHQHHHQHNQQETKPTSQLTIGEDNYLLDFTDNWNNSSTPPISSLHDGGLEFNQIQQQQQQQQIHTNHEQSYHNNQQQQHLVNTDILTTTTTTTTTTSNIKDDNSIDYTQQNNNNDGLELLQTNNNSNLILSSQNEQNIGLDQQQQVISTTTTTDSQQQSTPTIVSYSPDTSPSLEQTKIICLVSGFDCFDKKTNSIYYSFWAVFDNGIEVLALPIAPSVLEFISPIWGDAAITHFHIICKQNSMRSIIQQSQAVPFLFTPSDHRGKLKIAFDRCKIYPPIFIIPKFRHSVKYLDLSNNAITNVDFLSGFYRLETLYLNNNLLTEHIVFPTLPELVDLDLSCNKINFPKVGTFTESYKLFCFRLFQSNPSLQILNLRENEEYPSPFKAPHHHYNYRIYIISKFPQLTRLDLQPVSVEERKHAQNVEEDWFVN